MIKQATLEDVIAVACNMRAHDRAERLALSYGDNSVEAATRFLNLPHLAVTVWRGEAPVAVIGAVFAHPGVASTIFFATDEFPKVALATTRFVRRTLFPILVETGVHRLQVCSMENPADKLLHHHDRKSYHWIESFGATRETWLLKYGKNGENFALYTIDKAGMAGVTSAEN